MENVKVSTKVCIGCFAKVFVAGLRVCMSLW